MAIDGKTPRPEDTIPLPDAPEASATARSRALAAAMRAFDEKQARTDPAPMGEQPEEEKKNIPSRQGSGNERRLIRREGGRPDPARPHRRPLMHFKSLAATAFVAVLALSGTVFWLHNREAVSPDSSPPPVEAVIPGPEVRKDETPSMPKMAENDESRFSSPVIVQTLPPPVAAPASPLQSEPLPQPMAGNDNRGSASPIVVQTSPPPAAAPALGVDSMQMQTNGEGSLALRDSGNSRLIISRMGEKLREPAQEDAHELRRSRGNGQQGEYSGPVPQAGDRSEAEAGSKNLSEKPLPPIRFDYRNAAEPEASDKAKNFRMSGGFKYSNDDQSPVSASEPPRNVAATPAPNQDSFTARPENPFKTVKSEPVSTFSLDVDTASYAFMRAALAQNRLPPPGSVRPEEFVNYFPYDYPKPANAKEPFAATVSVFPSPWSDGRKIMHVGIEGYAVKATERPRANLVFLIDTSGSMDEKNKLPLVKQSLAMLIDALDPKDSVAIVTYAGQAGIALQPTPVAEKAKILRAVKRLGAGGSTAGAEGLRTAYDLAKRHFDKNGINRIVLATDGDFNVGMIGLDELKNYIARERKSGVFLSVLGFGMGNYKDDRMQVLAQNGNGIAAYIDTLSEARKVLIHEATSSIVPIAKDVKVQVEFNPTVVLEYRLIGYEKRLLRREDFNNDAIDAGEVGSGHSVTALYEFIPVGSAPSSDELRYVVKPAHEPALEAVKPEEYAFVKLRYKLPDSDVSTLISTAVPVGNAYATFDAAPQEARFATAVAMFGEILRQGRAAGQISLDEVLRIAQNARGDDPFGYRAEFVQLVRAAKTAKE